jgi:ATP-dependent DNA ligase
MRGSSPPLPPGFIPPCLLIASDKYRSGVEWGHEIKHDGYRRIARRMATTSRLKLEIDLRKGN